MLPDSNRKATMKQAWRSESNQAIATVSKTSLLAHIAQAVEHFLGKEEVTGSSPVMGSNISIKF